MRNLLKRFSGSEDLARRMISIYPLSARLGRHFWKWYAFFEESQTWSLEKLQAYQFEQLRLLLARLAETSPAYAKRLAGVAIQDIRSMAEFQRSVPSLSRAEFASNYAQILSRNFQRRACVPSGTSGTTGNALQFFHSVENQQFEWAAICHQWKRVGFDPAKSRRAEFRGLTRPGSLFQRFPEQNMVRISILDLNGKALPVIAEEIKRQRATFFHGYPSAIYLLAKEVTGSGQTFPQPEAILLASEMVYDFQVEQIQTAFPKARLFAHYGCAERTILAAWCEHRRVYHVLPQYSLVEIDAGTGEIMGTNLYNSVNGFVRYRMTDTAAGIETSACTACRRQYVPVIVGIDGRQEDFIYSRERGWIPPAIVTYPLKGLRDICGIQFQQDNPDEIKLKYFLRTGANHGHVDSELKSIESGLRRLVGGSIRLDFEQVDDIPRGPTGKFKWIVSKLNPQLDVIKSKAQI